METEHFYQYAFTAFGRALHLANQGKKVKLYREPGTGWVVQHN